MACQAFLILAKMPGLYDVQVLSIKPLYRKPRSLGRSFGPFTEVTNTSLLRHPGPSTRPPSGPSSEVRRVRGGSRGRGRGVHAADGLRVVQRRGPGFAARPRKGSKYLLGTSKHDVGKPFFGCCFVFAFAFAFFYVFCCFFPFVVFLCFEKKQATERIPMFWV